MTNMVEQNTEEQSTRRYCFKISHMTMPCQGLFIS